MYFKNTFCSLKFHAVSFFTFSPDGQKVRSKPELARILGESFDLASFDFRSGKMLQSSIRKSKRLRGSSYDYARGLCSLLVGLFFQVMYMYWFHLWFWLCCFSVYVKIYWCVCVSKWQKLAVLVVDCIYMYCVMCILMKKLLINITSTIHIELFPYQL